MSEWISPKNCLPSDKQLVLVAMDAINLVHHNIHLGYFYCESGWELPYYDGIVKVKYWMEIPTLPESLGS